MERIRLVDHGLNSYPEWDEAFNCINFYLPMNLTLRAGEAKLVCLGFAMNNLGYYNYHLRSNLTLAMKGVVCIAPIVRDGYIISVTLLNTCRHQVSLNTRAPYFVLDMNRNSLVKSVELEVSLGEGVTYVKCNED